jgi:hypothetical protein
MKHIVSAKGGAQPQPNKVKMMMSPKGGGKNLKITFLN